MAEEKKVLLSINDLWVKFRVRGRVLTAIRGVSLDIYENESIAIVGESGSGKSVFTKTFAGMLDSNGFIDNGSIIFNDEELADTHVRLTPVAHRLIGKALHKLNEASKLEAGAGVYQKILELEAEKRRKTSLSDEEKAAVEAEYKDLVAKRTDAFNLKQTFDPAHEKDKIRETAKLIKDLDGQIKAFKKKEEQLAHDRKAAAANDAAFNKKYQEQSAALKAQYQKAIAGEISPAKVKRNEILAKEIYLSVGRYGIYERVKMVNKLLKGLEKAMKLGVDLDDESQRNAVFDSVTFRVRYLDETAEALHGTCVLNLARVQYAKDWCQIRGRRIATVFQDPMTSLNPIITIGKQITSIILKHQNCTEAEARRRALELMRKVGIPKAEARFDDYPFQYSGGMRQRIVIAIALSCQPKILICDEPTTALDVTIQAQILELMTSLQKELGMAIIMITHDLGVVAQLCDEVIVMYAGSICEQGTADEIFYNPGHEYTKGLMRSIPSSNTAGKKLQPITGTPIDLLNMPAGCPFAPRCDAAMKICIKQRCENMQLNGDHRAACWMNVKRGVEDGSIKLDGEGGEDHE